MNFPKSYKDNDFWLDIENVVIGPEIGKGQFSTVYVGKYFGDLVAVKKQIRTGVMVEAYILRELSVLKVATHSNLVQYIGACNHENIDDQGHGASYIVTELCVGGDLLRLLLNKELELSWKTRIKIAMQAADAIHFLHKKHIIHRDIKSSNILLDEDWNCKISDFGMARFVEVECFTPPRINSSGNSNDNSSSGVAEKTFNKRISSSSSLLTGSRRMTICGTEEYMAPEMLFDEEYSFGVDIFCFGMMVFEILKRGQINKDSFLARKPKEKFMINHEAVKALLPADMPESMYSLAEQCTDFDPSMRPDSEQTLDWMQDIFEHAPNDDTSSTSATAAYKRSQSIRLALSVLAAREGESTKQQPPSAEQFAGKSVPASNISMFSPQPVPPPAGKISFTSPSGVFKSLFHSAGGAAAAASSNNIHDSYALPPLSAPSQLSAAEVELYQPHILREEEYKLPSAGSDTSEHNEEGDTVLKEGYLFKINETGFRNWKQVLCTLTDTKLSWVSMADTSKRIVFTLKDTTIRRTRDKRFLLSQKVLAVPSNKALRAKSGEAKEVAETGGTRYRSGTPDSISIVHPTGGATAGSGLTAIAQSQSTSSSSVSGSYGASSAIGQMQHSYSLLQKELAAQSVEEMESWICAIQEAISAAAGQQRLTDSPDALSIHTGAGAPGAAGGHSQPPPAPAPTASLEDCVSVEQWLYTTGLPAEYCELYHAAFEAKGYDSLGLIAKVGLQDSDLDYLEITVPSHRRVLSACARGHFSATLRLCVTSASKSDGYGGFVVRVISRWHYHRSALHVPLTLLRKFDKMLRKTVQHDARIQNLPTLQSESSQTNKVVRYKVELYLLQMATVLHDSPYLVYLLKFLELGPTS